MDNRSRIYLHIGGGRTVRERDIIGVFDTDSATQGKATKDYLRRAEKEGLLENIKEDIPKSFILLKSENKKPAKVFMVPFAPRSLVGRME